MSKSLLGGKMSKPIATKKLIPIVKQSTSAKYSTPIVKIKRSITKGKEFGRLIIPTITANLIGLRKGDYIFVQTTDDYSMLIIEKTDNSKIGFKLYGSSRRLAATGKNFLRLLNSNSNFAIYEYVKSINGKHYFMRIPSP